MTHIRYVSPVPAHAATGLAARVCREVERDFGMLAPPLTLHAAAPATLAATWLMLRETLLVPGLVSRAAKEAVAAAVSLANRCPYCVDVHGTTLGGLLRGPDAAAVAADRIDAVTDPHLRALARWARASGIATASAGAGTPFPPAQAPELIGVAVTFHYINRMVNVFLCDSPLPPVPAAALGPVRRVAARILAGVARIVPRSTESADLLPDAPLPADLSWAGGQGRIAAAFARASAAIDAGGTRAVPERVRRLVTARLAGDTDVVPGLGSRAWLDRAVADLPERERPAGRLALLTAFSSYQVTDGLVVEFVAQGHGDDALIELASWASLAAACRIGAHLGRDSAADPSRHAGER